MADNIFMDPGHSPDEEAVARALGDKFAWFEAICDAGDDFEQEWKHYGKKYGWKLKVHDYVKTLFELTIAEGDFRIGMAVRERELQALRLDPVLSTQLGDLLTPEKFAEGWGIRVLVDRENVFLQVMALVTAVAAMRGGD